jgi:hypothetical protein
MSTLLLAAQRQGCSWIRRAALATSLAMRSALLVLTLGVGSAQCSVRAPGEGLFTAAAAPAVYPFAFLPAAAYACGVHNTRVRFAHLRAATACVYACLWRSLVAKRWPADVSVGGIWVLLLSFGMLQLQDC